MNAESLTKALGGRWSGSSGVADNFDYSFRSILRTCSCLPMIDVPTLASEQRSQYLVKLRPAIKQLQDFRETIQHSDEENEPARRMKSRPARWEDAASRAVSATEIDFDSAIETVNAAEDADLPLGFGRD